MILMYSDRYFHQLIKDPGTTANSYDELAGFFRDMNYVRIPKLDRTGTLPHFMEIHTTSPIPEEIQGVTFEGALMSKALDMIATNKPIKVFWSGGVDSTVVVVALLKAGIPKDQLTVVMTPPSINEYQWFFNNILQAQDIPYDIRIGGMGAFNYPTNPDDIWSTGDLAEAIYHPGNVVLHHDNVDYKPIVPEYIQAYLEPMIVKAPIPIKTIWEYVWWVRFNMFWDEWKVRPIILAEGPIHSAMSVYDSPEMQSWSYRNFKPDNLYLVNKVDSYRPDGKKFIIDYTKDEGYSVKSKGWSFIPNDNYNNFKFLNDDYTKEMM